MASTVRQLDLILKLKDEASRKLKGFRGSLNNATSAIFSMKGALIGLTGGLLVSKVVEYGNAVQNLNNRLVSVTGSQEEANEQFIRLGEIAKRSRSDIETVTSVFARFELVQKQIGGTTQETEQMVETLSKGLQAFGSTTGEVNSVMLQLSQAFGSGRLAGDEFRSVSENFPPLLDALAKSTGMARGELKEFAADGGITSKMLKKALLGMTEEIEDKFSKMPVTIGQATTMMRNSFIIAGKKINDQTGVFDNIAKAILNVSKVITASLDIVLKFTASHKNLSKTILIVASVVGVLATSLLFLGGPFTAIMAVIGGIIAILYKFRGAIIPLVKDHLIKLKDKIKSLAPYFIHLRDIIKTVQQKAFKVLVKIIKILLPQLVRLKNLLKDVAKKGFGKMIELAKKLKPHLVALKDVFGGKLNENITKFKEGLEKLEPFLISVKDALVIMVKDGLVKMAEIFEKIRPFLEKHAGLILKILGVFILISSPILLFIGLIVLMIQHWDKIQPKVEAFWEIMKKVWDIMVKVWTIIATFLVPIFKILWEYIKDLGESLSDLWVTFKELWDLLAPILLPVLKWMAIIIGVVVVGAIIIFIATMALLTAIIIKVISWVIRLINWFTKMSIRAIEDAKNMWSKVGGFFGKMIDKIKDFLNIFGLAKDSETSFDASISGGGGGGRITGVNDAIITPKGDIVKTNPKDYLIATKTPGALAGGGGGGDTKIEVNINGGIYTDKKDLENLMSDILRNTLNVAV